MKEYFLEGIKTKIKILVKKKKKKWVAQTAYLTAEGESEKSALHNLSQELKILSESIDELKLDSQED